MCTATHCGSSPRRLNGSGRLLGNFEYQRTHFHGDVDDGANVYVDDGAKEEQVKSFAKLVTLVGIRKM